MDCYTQLNEIGRGGFGKAVLCTKNTMSNLLQYAMKIIDIGSYSPEDKRKAQEEALLLKRLNHPYIVAYENSFLDGRNLCIVMEYCEGGDLLTLIYDHRDKGVPLSEDQMWEWFIQICVALNYLHGRRIVHRDIKPQNIFTAKDGIVRLGDFGLAKVFENSDAYAYASRMATTSFSAPETINGSRYTNKCDIWSLGCVLYNMAMLKAPFKGTNPIHLAKVVEAGNYSPMLQSHSSDLQNMIGRLINVDAIERPTVTDILATGHIKARARPKIRLKKLYDYKLVNGSLVDSKGNGFNYEFHPTKKDNENRYEGIAVLFEEIVYDELEALGLTRLPVPNRPVAAPEFEHPGSFIYATKNWRDVRQLLVLIHGGHGGLVKAGQWSRKQAINGSIDEGTQLPYIRKALASGYGVMTLNTTDVRHDIDGCKSPEDHASYVWRNYVATASAVQIALKAHSAGGSVSFALFSEFEADFKRRVFVNALTGSSVPAATTTQEYIRKVTRNWDSSSKSLGTILPPIRGFQQVSAGTRIHQEIPYKSIDNIFKFIGERFGDTSPGNL